MSPSPRRSTSCPASSALASGESYDEAAGANLEDIASGLGDLYDDTGWYRLKVRLACPVEPHVTNGEWDGELRQVTWSGSIGAESAPALFSYAVWAEPDAEFQAEHFGRVVLGGEDLGEYVIWRSGLTEDEGRQWDEFVSGLKPGADLEDELEGFGFADSPDLADTPRRVLTR
jgi:hypothetical protein